MAYNSGDSDTTISETPEVRRQKAEAIYDDIEKSPEFKIREKTRNDKDASKKKTPISDDSLARRTFEAGEYLFLEGEDGDEAYLLLSGQVNIIRKVGEAEIVVAQVGAGSIVGEMALIDAEPRMATARAVAETVVTIIPSKDLKVRLDRLEKTDPVMRRLVGMFVQRMRDARIISMDS
jgi:CRP-like cAMP-binding protein